MRTKISPAHPSCFPCYEHTHTRAIHGLLSFSAAIVIITLARRVSPVFPPKKKKKRNYVKDRCLSPLSLSLSLSMGHTLFASTVLATVIPRKKGCRCCHTHIAPPSIVPSLMSSNERCIGLSKGACSSHGWTHVNIPNSTVHPGN